MLVIIARINAPVASINVCDRSLRIRQAASRSDIFHPRRCNFHPRPILVFTEQTDLRYRRRKVGLMDKFIIIPRRRLALCLRVTRDPMN